MSDTELTERQMQHVVSEAVARVMEELEVAKATYPEVDESLEDTALRSARILQDRAKELNEIKEMWPNTESMEAVLSEIVMALCMLVKATVLAEVRDPTRREEVLEDA